MKKYGFRIFQFSFSLSQSAAFTISTRQFSSWTFSVSDTEAEICRFRYPRRKKRSAKRTKIPNAKNAKIHLIFGLILSKRGSMTRILRHPNKKGTKTKKTIRRITESNWIRMPQNSLRKSPTSIIAQMPDQKCNERDFCSMYSFLPSSFFEESSSIIFPKNVFL